MSKIQRTKAVRIGALVLMLTTSATAGCIAPRMSCCAPTTGAPPPSWWGPPHLVADANGTDLVVAIGHWTDPSGYTVTIIPYPNGSSVGYDLGSCGSTDERKGMRFQRSNDSCNLTLDSATVLGGVPSAAYISVFARAPKDILATPAGSRTGILQVWDLGTSNIVRRLEFVATPGAVKARNGAALNLSASAVVPAGTSFDPTNVTVMAALDWMSLDFTREGFLTAGLPPNHTWLTTGNRTVFHATWSVVVEGLPAERAWVQFRPVLFAPTGYGHDLIVG